MNQVLQLIRVQAGISGILPLLILVFSGGLAAVACLSGCLTSLGGTVISAWIVWHKSTHKPVTSVIKLHIFSEITKIFFSIFVILLFFLGWPEQGLWYLLGLVSVTTAYWFCLLGDFSS